MEFLLIALGTTIVGASPGLLLGVGETLMVAVPAFFITFAIAYFGTPSIAYPFYGVAGLIVLAMWFVFPFCLKRKRRLRSIKRIIWALPFALLALFAGRAILSWEMLNADQYAAKAGVVEHADWTHDVQPKDPRHMRMVPYATALYLARKAIAQDGAIGSQFSLDEDHLTLQKVRDRLIYAIPLDYNSVAKWASTDGVPGWIIVDAEDPERVPDFIKAKDGAKLKYMPSAYFSNALERHIREAGITQSLSQLRFEIDEDGRPWWVTTISQPTSGWSVPTPTGVVVIDPVTGDVKSYPLSAVPTFIDVVFNQDLVKDYLALRGTLSKGWWNSFWAGDSLTEPATPILVYGADGRPQWVTGLTSKNRSDDSLVGLVYTDARTNKSVQYATAGGATDSAIERAVESNPNVTLKRLRAAVPQIYNVEGAMTAVVPMTNSAGGFGGLAMVEVANVQAVAYGETQSQALTAYKAILTRHGQQIVVGTGVGEDKYEGLIDRIAPNGGSPSYIFHIAGVPKLFAVSSADYPKVPVTVVGDRVTVTSPRSQSEIRAVRTFDNLSLPLSSANAETGPKDSAAAAPDLVRKTPAAPDRVTH